MPADIPSNPKYLVKVRSADLDAPTLVDRIGRELLDHLVTCPRCATVFAAQEVSIDKAGCVEGIRILSQSKVSWQERRSALALKHLSEETLDDYLFDRLTCDERAPLEHHARFCLQCATKIRERETLIGCIKEVLRERQENVKNSAAPEAVVGVRFPARALSACSRSKLNKNRQDRH